MNLFASVGVDGCHLMTASLVMKIDSKEGDVHNCVRLQGFNMGVLGKLSNWIEPF